MTEVLNSLKKVVLGVVGTVSLVIGIVGVIIPFFPGTPFLILAGICFWAMNA
ncbi:MULTISPECIES: DUF454 family protein [Nostocales]|uniref:DUF454 domain-containing protein n=3 Tax=Nostocales TaxID=1161 RepID=A0A8S9T7L2_9CYAN|nr:DUF454 family protein [Tolypothrix bouteillei]KAF3888048.1 DUF454 domain-containing protein [Tolypothrix bouteillei VB521301]